MNIDCKWKPLPPRQKLPDHELLRRVAVRWLTATKKCTVVLSELHTAAREIPDAVGWNCGVAHLVECKISRGDLQANATKTHVRADRGIGRYRYVMVPKGLIEPEEFSRIEHFKGYGLLIVTDSNVRRSSESELFESCQHNEVLMLLSALRRIKLREFIAIVPELPENA